MDYEDHLTIPEHRTNGVVVEAGNGGAARKVDTEFDDRFIIDTPPMSSSDAAALAPVVGEIVFVIEAHNTQQAEIEARLRTLSVCLGSASRSTRLMRRRASILAIMVTDTIPLVAGAMSRARRTLRRAPASHASWQWHFYLTLCGFLLASLLSGNPAIAQVEQAGPQTPSNAGGETAPTTPGGGVGVTPAIPGPAPTTLPPPPAGGLGTPNPAAPPYSVNTEAPTLVSPPTLRLSTPGIGVVPLQAYDPTAPAILITPTAFLGETFTDNVFYAQSPRKFAAISQLGAGASISVDTPRLQAVATGSANGLLYLPSNLSSLNYVYGSLYANGTGTFYPGLAYVDFQSSITQSTTQPGFGFQTLSTLPSNQQTQQYQFNISPYLVHSFGGNADTMLRYTFSSVNYGGNTTVVTAPLVPGLNTLASSTLNEGTFIAATGENFQKALARFTADASEYNNTSVSQNTQVSAFGDFSYQFKPSVAALWRIGYQNLRFPFTPEANFAGPTWLAGGRLGTLDPVQPAYVLLEYGVQQGSRGVTGSAQVNITPSMVLSASAVQGTGSQGQFFQSALANSALSPSGGIINQTTGLPIPFYNPGLGLTNNVYRQHLYNAGLTDSIPPNSYSLFLFYNVQQSLTPPITAPVKSVGINFTYTRDIRPNLSGYASVGYSNSTNAVSIMSPTSTTTFNSVNASLALNYVLTRNLTGSIVYSLYHTNNGTVLVNGSTGDVFVNQLQLLLSKTF